MKIFTIFLFIKMFIISFLLILSIVMKNISCSLLSRLKNRYEYITQENNLHILTDDLYDFEFTNNHLTTRTSLDIINEIDPAEENLYYISNSSVTQYSNDSLYDSTHHKRNPITFKSTIEINITTIAAEDESYYIIRPTINPSSTWTDISSSKRRKSWPTYFPRNTLSLPPLTENTVAPTNVLPILREMKKITLYPWILIKEHTQDTAETNDVTTMKLERNETTTESNDHTITQTASITPNISVRPNVFITSVRETVTTPNTEASVTTTKVIQRKVVKSSCYMCGLNETRIPMPYCYYTFEGDDQRFSRRKHRFKVKCIRSEMKKKEKNVYYGPWYRGGCFKRFLDVGVEYNERGCRTFTPLKGKSFASKRFSKMEHLLNHLNDGCVFSPHASITPFNRAISLFARYHVCVCSKKYCNRSNVINLNSYLMLILLVLTLYIYIYNI